MGAPFRSSSSADREALAAALERARDLVGERRPPFRAADMPNPNLLAQSELATKAKALMAGRRARDRLFGGSGMFGEPAWDIMLELFAAEAVGRKVSVTNAATAAHVAPSTALRWIDKLVQMGLLEREADHLDRRRHFLRLSEQATELMRLAIIVS